jgi:hypothetical protein
LKEHGSHSKHTQIWPKKHNKLTKTSSFFAKRSLKNPQKKAHFGKKRPTPHKKGSFSVNNTTKPRTKEVNFGERAHTNAQRGLVFGGRHERYTHKEGHGW